ncbi:MAG: MFS transporter [Acidobacteriota bacterium]
MDTQAVTPEQQRWRYRIFAVTWFAYAGFYLCRKNFSVAMPLLANDLGYTKMQFATVIFGYSLVYALGQFANGVLSDRFGSRLVVGIGLAVSIVSNLVMGFVSSLFLFTVLASVNGAGQSTGWPGLVKNMANWFRPRERGVVMGWWGTNYVLGGSFATIFATFWAVHPGFRVDWGWRRGFWLPALVLTVVALVYVLFTRNKPTDAGVPDVLEKERPEEQARPSSRLLPRRGERRSQSILKPILAEPAVWTIAVAYFFIKMTRYSFLFWLPLYMTEHLRYQVAEAGYVSALYEMVGFSGAILAGYASDKLMQSRRFPVGAVMLWGLAVVCFLHPLMAAEGRVGLAVWIALVGIMTYGPDTLMSGAAAQDLGSPSGSGTAAGLINGVGSLGQLVSPFLVALVTNHYGWDNLFSLFVVFALFGGGLLATRWSYRPGPVVARRESGASV